MTRLGRKISQGFKTFGRQLQRGTDTFGRQLSNTSRDIASGMREAQKHIAGVEKALSGVPIVGGAVQAVGDVLNTGLGVGANLNSALGSAGDGLRDMAFQRYDDAQRNFTNASNAGVSAMTPTML